MLDVVLGVVALLAFILLLWVYFIVRPKQGISIYDYFMLFFLLQFGPHAFFPGTLSAFWDLTSDAAHVRYYWGLTFSYLSIALGLFSGNRLFEATKRSGNALQSVGSIGRNAKYFLCGSVVAYIIIFIALGGIDRLGIIGEYLTSENYASYSEMRREMFQGTWLSKVSALTRYSLTATLFAVVAGYSAHKKISAIVAFGFCSATVLLCAAQMNKLVYVYYALLYLLTYFHTRHSRTMAAKTFKVSVLLKYALIGMVVVLLLSGLVRLQYRSFYEAGADPSEHILSLIAYRVLISNHDGLVLYFDMYPDQQPFTRLANIGLLAKLLQLEHVDPTVEIPRYYLSTDSTSIQSGYIASSYASFGFVGLILNGIGVGILIGLLSYIGDSLIRLFYRPIYIALVGLNMYFLMSSQFHTALLSGGVLLIPILFIIFMGKIKLYGTQPAVGNM